MSTNKINFNTAISVVIANMIGTGVFTSLGYQLLGIHDLPAILLLWIIGGIIALFGSFAYSELGAALPRSGGEYNFLSEIFHPSLGFLSGWVSATIGFAAPIAAAALALGNYAKELIPVEPTLIGASVIIAVAALQSINYAVGGGFQTIATSLKVIFILLFIGLGMFCAANTHISIMPTLATSNALFTGGFAISLVYVSYAYSGWNASAYIAGEVENPQKNIPLSILVGTVIVGTLYVLLNFVFLKTAPVAELTGVQEVGFVSAKYIFGENGGKIIAGIISVLLVSTISSMIIVGPRVVQMIGEDYPVFAWVASKNKAGIPVKAIWMQALIALVLLFTSSFEMILTYISFTLTLSTTLTVVGVMVLRKTNPTLPRPYKTWGYPLTPIIFILANCWFLYFVFTGKTKESFIGLGILAVGLLVYFLVRKNSHFKSINQ